MARILIVEDDRSTANMLWTVMTVDGYVPTIVRTAEEAIREVQTVGYDLVLLDIGLPGLDGWFVLRTFRHIDNPPPVIVVSGQIDQGHDDHLKAISMGASAAILKPFDHDELCRTVIEALASR